MTQLSLYGRCFDATLDTSIASLGSVTTYIRTGDVVAGFSQSKFLIEGVLLFLGGRVQRMGFSSTTPTEFAVEWVSPASRTHYQAVLDLKSGRFLTSAPNNFALHGFALAGFGAALAHQRSAFRTRWVELLADLSTAGIDACTDETLAGIASELSQALVGMDPLRAEGHGWFQELSHNALIFDDRVVDVRDHMLTVESFVALTNAFTDKAQGDGGTRFQGTQLRNVRSLLRRRKHTVLLGPPGVGKTISAFEALALEGYTKVGVDFQLFTGHDEVKSADFLGGWQPSGEVGRYTWVSACLVRAMTANEGRGQPILVEEFTRMPTRAQNMFISALSDGYVVLNEKPSATGEGEVITAGPDFVLLADMNVDPAADDIDVFGAAFSSRVRKVEYDYPSPTALMTILEHEVGDSTKLQRQAITSMYDALLKRWRGQEIEAPISPRACVHWLEDIVAEMAERASDDQNLLRLVAQDTAAMTWLRDVAGTNASLRKVLLSDAEACFRRAGGGVKS